MKDAYFKKTLSFKHADKTLQFNVSPLVSIGGINAANASSMIGAGALGLAVISDLMHADDPDEAARRFQAAIRPEQAR